MDLPAPGSKILVIGVSGSGKTTFARAIAKLLQLKQVELDTLYWEKNWQPADPDLVRKRIRSAFSEGNWVCDGNYSSFRDLTWSSADTVIWLDYGFFTIMTRLFFRTIKRIITGEVLWNGNRESFRDQFLSKESLFLWAFKTYFIYRKEYLELIEKKENSHLQVFRFKTPRQAERWLSSLKGPSTTSGA